MDHLVDVNDQAAISGSSSFHQANCIRKIVDHGAAHDFEPNCCPVLAGVLAKCRKGLNQDRHGDNRVVKIPDLDMSGMQHCRSLEQPFLAAVRFALAGAFQEPVRQEFQFQVSNAVIVEDRFHFFKCAMHKDMFQVRVPDAETLKPGVGGCLHPILKIEAANLGLAWEDPGGCPVQTH